MKDTVYWRMHVGIVSRNINTDLFNSQIIIVIKKEDYSRQITSIIYRFKSNAFRTKCSNNIKRKYICGAQLTTNHIHYKCQPLHSYLPMMVCNRTFSEHIANPHPPTHPTPIVCNHLIMSYAIQPLINSPITGSLLDLKQSINQSIRFFLIMIFPHRY